MVSCSGRQHSVRGPDASRLVDLHPVLGQRPRQSRRQNEALDLPRGDDHKWQFDFCPDSMRLDARVRIGRQDGREIDVAPGDGEVPSALGELAPRISRVVCECLASPVLGRVAFDAQEGCVADEHRPPADREAPWLVTSRLQLSVRLPSPGPELHRQ